VEEALEVGNAVLAQVEAIKPDYLTIAHPKRCNR
jgi:hypothetical protein